MAKHSPPNVASVLQSGGLSSPFLSVSRDPPNKGLKKLMTENSPQRDLTENKNLVLISKTATVMWCVCSCGENLNCSVE